MRRRARRGFSLAVVFGALALAVAVSGQAADSKKAYGLRGSGALRCKDLVEQVQKNNRDLMVQTESWVQGYITAANRGQPDTYDISPVLDPDGLLTMIARRCQAEPDATVATALDELLARLYPVRVKTESPVVKTKSGNNTAVVREQTLAAMQAKLAQYGYFKGKADGIYSPKTESALKAFQKDQKFAETGVPDWMTTVQLLVNLPPKKQ